MLTILVRLIGFIAPYSTQIISLLSGLSLKQIGYILVVLGLITSHWYMYDLGGDNRQYEIERKAREDAENKQKKIKIIRNRAVDDTLVIDRLRKDF